MDQGIKKEVEFFTYAPHFHTFTLLPVEKTTLTIQEQ